MDSDRVLSQYNQANDLTSEHETEHQVSLGVSVVSAGLAGAVIGNMVAGRLGAAIGAVVGGVAGVAIGQTDAVEGAVEGAVDTVKEKVEGAKPAVTNALQSAQTKVADATSAAKNAVSSAQDKAADLASSTSDAADSRFSTANDMNFARDMGSTPQSDVLGAVETAAPTIHTSEVQTQVQSTTQASDAFVESPVEDIGTAYISSDSSFDAATDNTLSVEEQYDRGIALGKEGNMVGSIAAFQSVIAQDPDYAEAHYNLGVVLGKHGLREQGIEHIQKSRDLCKMQGRSREADNIEQILIKLGAE